jgi:hypothetical protein
MPQILNEKAWSDQGRINMPEMMKVLKVSQNTAYRLRKDLLRQYHEQKPLRDGQWEPSPIGETTSSSKQEE